jgi:hypothetical protein
MKFHKKPKGKIAIKRFIRKTAGGKHGWYEAEVTDDKGTATVEVRKQLRTEDR